MSHRNYDRRGKVWSKVRRKRKPGYPPKSDNPLERKETVAIGLRAAGKLVGAFKRSEAGGVAAYPEKRTDKADTGARTPSEAGERGAKDSANGGNGLQTSYALLPFAPLTYAGDANE